MLIQLLYIFCCIYVIQALRKNSKKKGLRPPELAGALPLIGYTHKMLGDRKDGFNIIKQISEMTMQCGGVSTVKIGPRNIYILSEPEDCLQLANECLDKDFFYKFAKPFLGNGLTIAEVPLWRQHRKLISPAFRQQNLNDYLVVFNNQANKLAEKMKREIGRGYFNHENYIRINSLETISMTSFGADVENFGEIHQQFLEGADEMLDIVTERTQKFWLHNDFLYRWSDLKKREEICFNKIKPFTTAILTKRKAEMQDLKNCFDKTGQFTPFMSYLLEISEKDICYTQEDILHESITLVSAGYDTSAVTTTIALMLIGAYPEVQEKAYQELHEIFGDSDRDVSKEDLLRLIYLEAVLKESMRLYPIAPVIARHLVKDVKLKQYTLEANNGVIISLWAVHRHPSWGADADQFRPARWLDGSLPIPTHAFGAFSFGKRACIGKMHAMMSIKTTLAHILRRYRISSDISKMEFELHASLKMASGQNLAIEERNPKIR